MRTPFFPMLRSASGSINKAPSPKVFNDMQPNVTFYPFISFLIKTITIKALQSTNPGMLRLFFYDGTNYFLFQEVMIPETIQSGHEPSYKVALDENFFLKSGYTIVATTQIAQSFAFTVEGYDWIYPIS